MKLAFLLATLLGWPILFSPAHALGQPDARASANHVVRDQSQLVDINSASEQELRTLPGIGPARSQAIIAGRPYGVRDDLVKRNILPKNVYEGFKDRIVAKQK